MKNPRTWVGLVLVALLVVGVAILVRTTDKVNRINVVGYFDNSNGIYVGDDVRILGVPVGRITAIEPEPERVKISFWYDDRYDVPADANAAILSPAPCSGSSPRCASSPSGSSSPRARKNRSSAQRQASCRRAWVKPS